MIDGHVAALHIDTRQKGVGDLAILYDCLDVIQRQSYATAIVYRRLSDRKFGLVNFGRIGNNAVEGAMYIGVLDVVFIRLRIELDALPLTRNSVVGQIGEHAVKP